MVHGLRLFVVVALCNIGWMANTNAQDEDFAKAQKLKSAYLYNFIKFANWPQERSPITLHKVQICIMGDSPFGSYLDTLKSGLSSKMEVNIVDVSSVAEVSACHVLFISQVNSIDLDSVLATARKHSVLTVSEAEDFADRGGVVEMKTVQKSVGLFASNKINLRINVKTAEASALHISAQLLEFAAEVIK